MSRFVMAIDQGTTGSTVMVFDGRGRVRSRVYSEFTQYYPRPAWVEHDAEQIWKVTRGLLARACRKADIKPSALAAIGITNQRETTVVWDRQTGEPIHRAIVWQDRRTADHCRRLESDGLLPEVRKRTGLVLDPYFSGSKVAWILDHVRGARRRAERGELAFGTIDSWLIYKLTGGRVHATDYTNASRTMLFNIRRRRWDATLCRALGVPMEMLPEVHPSSGVFGTTVLSGAEIPIAGVAGDQQAALYGQACFRPGMIKNTYGTGCFMLMYTGDKPVTSRNRLLTTMACAPDGGPAYALEGSVFIAGAAVQWLRDGLGLLKNAADSEAAARRVDSTLGTYLVPAFTGLGAPYWDPDARGALVGLTRGVTADHVIRATLESLAYQSRDLADAMAADAGRKPRVLRVDGGAAANDFLMQFQADLLGGSVDRPRVVETTAVGAAFLAGRATGVWKGAADIEAARSTDRVFRPSMKPARRRELYEGWEQAVARVR
ncbi:MAG TPA: glycerol kinase [Deltaproteobacteria bacterium]|nr:glycerol kinase GlpK [Candidatus Binatota bacterium]HIL12680.1 glycerol kinase [Deltaproteobacteria bacterium]